MKIKDLLIEEAIKAVSDSGIANSDGKFEGEYKGYISAFGAAMIQSGLLPAVIFYENSSRSKSDKDKIIDAIVRILKTKNSTLYSATDLSTPLKKSEFSKFIIKNKDKKATITSDVNEAAVAIKLAIRTYEEIK